MRPVILDLALLLAAGLASGCTSPGNDSTAPTRQRDPDTAPGDRAVAETKEAAQAARDYAYAQKAEFIDHAKRDLAALERDLDELAARVESSTGEAKAGAETKLAEAREKWARAKAQLDRAESAAESSWADAKTGVEQSYRELKASVSTTRQWLSEKIAP